MRLLHASAMTIPWQLKQRFHFSCLTKVHTQKWSLPDSDANHTNVTKHLKWIVLSVGAIQAQSLFLNGIKYSQDCSVALHMWRQRKEIQPTHGCFSTLSPCLLGLRGRMSPAILVQSSNRQWNWSYHHKYAALLPKYKPSWAVIQNWLTGVRQKQEKLCVFRPSQCSFPAELWGWIRNILLVYFQDLLPGLLDFIIISSAWMGLAVHLAHPF